MASAQQGLIATRGAQMFPRLSAVGDIRASSVKQVAASVDDGAQVIAAIHVYLAEQSEQVGAEALMPVAV